MLMAAALIIPREAAAEIERIEKEELSAKLCSPQIVLLDVRTGEVWEKSKIKIKCSRRVDPYNVESWVDTIPKDKQIILYCCS
jgi:rhodanese-related sulfurtransferase